MPMQEQNQRVILDLVAQAQDGDTSAFAKIYDRFFASIYRYAALRVQRESAEDLAADTVV